MIWLLMGVAFLLGAVVGITAFLALVIVAMGSEQARAVDQLPYFDDGTSLAA